MFEEPIKLELGVCQPLLSLSETPAIANTGIEERSLVIDDKSVEEDGIDIASGTDAEAPAIIGDRENYIRSEKSNIETQHECDRQIVARSDMEVNSVGEMIMEIGICGTGSGNIDAKGSVILKRLSVL